MKEAQFFLLFSFIVVLNYFPFLFSLNSLAQKSRLKSIRIFDHPLKLKYSNQTPFNLFQDNFIDYLD